MQWLVFEAFHLLGLVPLLWLGALRWRGHRVAQQTYPVSQAALFALALLPSYRAVVAYVAVLVAVASASIMAREAVGVDLWLRSVAWGSVSLLAALTLPAWRLRSVLAVGFAALLAAWWTYAWWPGLVTYLLYQGIRLAVTGWWCWVAWTDRRRG